jgi:hypothetical protein
MSCSCRAPCATFHSAKDSWSNAKISGICNAGGGAVMNIPARYLPWIGGAADVPPGASFSPLVSPIDETVASHFVESDAAILGDVVGPRCRLSGRRLRNEVRSIRFCVGEHHDLCPSLVAIPLPGLPSRLLFYQHQQGHRQVGGPQGEARRRAGIQHDRRGLHARVAEARIQRWNGCKAAPPVSATPCRRMSASRK